MTCLMYSTIFRERSGGCTYFGNVTAAEAEHFQNIGSGIVLNNLELRILSPDLLISLKSGSSDIHLGWRITALADGEHTPSREIFVYNPYRIVTRILPSAGFLFYFQR